MASYFRYFISHHRFSKVKVPENEELPVDISYIEVDEESYNRCHYEEQET